MAPARLGVFCTGQALVCVLVTCIAHAAVLFVDPNVPDVLATDGACSLREAIINTNDDSATWPDCPSGSGADEIQLGPGTFTFLISESLRLDRGLTLSGAGADRTVIGANGTGPVLAARDADVVAVTITGGTIGTEAVGDLTLIDTVVTGNRGVGVFVALGTLALIRSTVSDNSANWGAGGVFLYGASLSTHNSTISGNRVDAGCGCSRRGSCVGGAVAGLGASVELSYTTIVDNECAGDTAQLAVGFGGSLSARATVFSSPSKTDCAGLSDSGGYNLDTGPCAPLAATDLNAVDPMLAPLGPNGGPTPTHRLLPGSPAIDRIPDADCTWDDDFEPNTPEVSLGVDQRGIARPYGIGCDVGAVEQDSFCGDGVVEGVEECDDGGTVLGDGCSDGCAEEVCGDGILHTPLGEECDDGNLGDGDGCSQECIATNCTIAPAPGCFPADKAILAIDERRPGGEKLRASLRRFDPALRPGTLGSPLAESTAYDLCVYDEENVLRGAIHVDRADDECGGKPCWKLIRNGVKYSDPAGESDGARRMAIKRGGSGAVAARAKNKPSEPQPLMPVGIADALEGHTSATVQLVTSDAGCVEATLENVRKADGAQFKAKAL